MLKTITCLLLFTACANAQTISGETERGTNTTKDHFFSQYVFFDTNRVTSLVRYTAVKGSIQRGEFAVGPTITLKQGVVKLYFGATTDREAMTSGLLATKIAKIGIVYIADAKWATKPHSSNAFYQKAFLDATGHNRWFLRIESLTVGRSYGFALLGVERRFRISESLEWAVAPFYDPKYRSVGCQADLRFQNLKPRL